MIADSGFPIGNAYVFRKASRLVRTWNGDRHPARSTQQGTAWVIVDTKFSSILGSRHFGGASLKSDYLYQMYAYVRSQEGLGLRSDGTARLFLHPAIEVTLYEHAVVQGHSIAFATVNLGGSAAAIRRDLREILSS